MRRLITLLTCALIAVPALGAAELRYTTRTETRTIPTSGPPNPIIGLIGGMLLTRMPAGTTTTIVGSGGVRMEFPVDMGMFPAGSVTLMRDGALTVLNPQQMTYWTVAVDQAGPAGVQLTPKVSSSRTGESATVAGLTAERTTFSLSIDLPIPPNMTLPPDIPRTLTMDGEMWVADRYREYGAVLAKAGNALVASLGLGVLPQDGFVVRQITRNALLGYEVEITVANIEEVPAAPELFQVPAGYRQIPPPRPTLPQ